MALADWVRRLFSPAAPEHGSEEHPSEAVITGGVPGLAGLEDAEAVQGVEGQFEAPSDPAP